MNLLMMILLAALLLAAAAYAQQQIARYTANPRQTLLTRALLLAVGVASGAVSAAVYDKDTATVVLAFISGFGAVHVPAAFILLIKRARGSGPT